MFSRNNGGNGDAPVPPGQDGPAGDPISVPEVPPMRTFKVTRLNETIELQAHEVEVSQLGNIIRFRQYTIHPNEGPTNRVVRCFIRPNDAWLEYEEILPEPSPIIQVPSGSRIQ